VALQAAVDALEASPTLAPASDKPEPVVEQEKAYLRRACPVARVKRVTVWTGHLVDKVTFEYEDGQVKSFGKADHGGVRRASWTVPEGEFIARIAARVGQSTDCIQFITTWGSQSPWYGGVGGSLKTFGCGSGEHVVGLSLEDAGGCTLKLVGIESAPVAGAAERAAEFLELCLGGPAALLETEIEAVQVTETDAVEEINDVDAVPTEASAPAPDAQASDQCGMFSIVDESGSEGDYEGPDLEDMFDFDPEKLAALMNNGANMDELTEHLQDAYADALERRLIADKTGSAAEDAEDDADRPHMGDSPLMTPEQVTPVVSPTGTSFGDATCCVAGAQKALDDTCRREHDRSRRSMAVQRRSSATQRGAVAVKAMEAFGRRSLAQAQAAGADLEGVEALQGAVQSAVRRVSLRHRRSVTKAVEVLEEVAESTDLPLDKWSDEQMDEKVELIQTAMEEAYKRHRRSIVAAARETMDAKADPGSLDNADPDDTSKAEDVEAEQPRESQESVEARIRNAVSVAYERHCAETMAAAARDHEWWAEHWSNAQNATVYDANQDDSGVYSYYDGAGYPQQWASYASAEGWNTQYQNDCEQYQPDGETWYPETGCHGGYASYGDYSSCSKTTSWDHQPMSFHAAPWRYGSG
jgi:hypothetical protein